MVEWKKTEYGECKNIKDVPSGAVILSVDDKDVDCFCESCGKPLFGDDYIVDEGSCEICYECAGFFG